MNKRTVENLLENLVRITTFHRRHNPDVHEVHVDETDYQRLRAVATRACNGGVRLRGDDVLFQGFVIRPCRH